MATVASDFNLQKLNTKELTENLKSTISFGGNVAIIARRGSGKTMISKQAIKESGCKELYLNLSVMERPDIGGYPDFSAAKEKRNYVEFLLPDFYKHLMEGNEPVVALLDEVDKTEKDLQAPLLEFTQFHSINGKPLPNLRAVIMTGNLQSEGGSRPSLPLLDRAEKYLVEVTPQHWLDWSSKSGQIHPSITAYIADNPDDLSGDVDPGDVYADQSPRGWHNASKIIMFGEKEKWSNKILTNKVAGCIGKKSGIKYAAYFDHYQIILPIVQKIVSGDTVNDFSRLEPAKQMVACMVACQRLSRAVDNAKDNSYELPIVKNVAKFLKGSNVDPEMTLIAVRSQIGLERMVSKDLYEDPGWDLILREISKRISS